MTAQRKESHDMQEGAMRTDLTVIVPMYNEEENAETLVEKLNAVLDAAKGTSEILLVDDGSTDRTPQVAKQLADETPRVRVISYLPNRGRGFAMRQGFAAARGEIVVTIEADLSYDPTQILDLVEVLRSRPQTDIVIGSPYMRGGRTVGVPSKRLLLSRAGNRVLGYAMSSGLTTVTGMFRAYRRNVLRCLDLEADRKEIHLEILSKALALGFEASEVPAVLRGRSKGHSKLRLGRTIVSHLLFSFNERPFLLFGGVGLGILLLGLATGGYLIAEWATGKLNPDRPLVTLLVLLLFTGMQVLLFGFLGTQLASLRKDVYKIGRRVRSMENPEIRDNADGSSE